ncbi:hypothetical protein DL765_003654 [Monosporascus sp. GIB2]|nr:hypothetical protein DL765_003654 [Monosporascus sp. GIB2]
MWVSRLVPNAGLQEYYEVVKPPTSRGGTEMLPLDSQGSVRAAFEIPGVLSSLYYQPYTELWKPLPQDWMEVPFDANSLSSEYTGVVTAAGSKAGFSVGGRVYGMGRGHLGNYTRVPAAFAQKLRLSGDLVEVAIMPLVYMSAIYAFEHVANLEKGHTVLIQSATGNLGLAAIQLARAKGAEVFATAGTLEKARFLVEAIGILSHIFSSRNVSGLSRAVSMIWKDGFDVILGTSRGDMLYASLKALAPLGHLIDVGRMDVQDAKAIGLELFQKSASFSSFVLTLVLDNDPVIGGELMQTIDQYYRTGQIGPIRPFTPTDVSQLDQVLLGFPKGTHIGKLVVTFQNPGPLVKMMPAAPAARFEPEACYIITGGLSGLGRSIIRGMSDREAQHCVVLFRRGTGSPEAQTLVETLVTHDVTVQSVACDVSKREQAMRAIGEASQQRPVKGIVHAAVSYQDLSLDKRSIERWQEGLAAKVLGTINLHAATSSLPVDFFVMITSDEPVFASATDQLEPAFFNNELTKTGSQWIGQQQDPLSAANFVTCMDPAAMAARKREGAEAGISWVASPRWYSDRRVSLIMHAFDDAQRHADDADMVQNAADQGGKSVAARLRREFDEAIKAGPSEPAKTLALARGGIITAMAEMLFIEESGINPRKTVADHGVDSLIAAELRNWFHAALGFNITMLDLLDVHTSINALAAKIVDGATASSSRGAQGSPESTSSMVTNA